MASHFVPETQHRDDRHSTVAQDRTNANEAGGIIYPDTKITNYSYEKIGYIDLIRQEKELTVLLFSLPPCSW